MRVVNLLLCDGQRMFSEALAGSLDDATHHVVAVVERADDLAEQVRDSHPDVCVLDLSTSDRGGKDLATTVRADCPGTRVLVLTARDDADLWRAYDLGLVDAVVSKIHGLGTIRTAVDRVALGERFALASARPPAPVTAAHLGLTEREGEILHLLAHGATTHQIMEALAISQHTVRSHVQHLLDKLQVHTRAQAVQMALAAHLVLEPNAAAS